MLGLWGGVGRRAFFFDGDTSLDLDGDAGGGGVAGLSTAEPRTGRASLGGELRCRD